ncbi:putative mfs-multidrug-resistance transporter [Ustilago hordei]|uniref:Probable mfs-multidrug-resistance transporter n=1 Tax=Ustilago hordei TaxID=120017 RepID=I2G1C5_USTHO|nr:putative mfs-multidrug-resistance transporter [Ustilago hordei]CCF52968.1 probable mfs-multidrug-resistance transporter [Ustilago hordei]SYW84204.1 probable mfs-multidrug-resistance transporter [Ustilago hordei]
MSQNTAQSPHAGGHAPRRFHTPKHGWLHEVEKRLVGQTPKGAPPARPRQSESHRSRPNSGGLDREVEAIFHRTARYGGDDPRDPQDQAYETNAPPDETAESQTSTRVPSSPTQPGAYKSKSKGQQSSSRNDDNDDNADSDDSDDNNDNDANSDQGRPRGNPDEAEDPNQVGWDGPDDPENPQNWSQKKKWAFTLLCSLLTVNVTFASSAPSSAIQQIAQEFQIGTVTATLITSLFLAGYCLGPIIWSTTSELVGRKVIFSISMLMYTLFILGQALAKNPETLFITRFISGVCAAAPLTNAGGVIADMWDPVGRGYAMSLFSCAVFIGPVMGPIVGGFITQSYLAWRWVFWIMMIFAGLCWVITVLFLPETFTPILLVRKAKRLRKLDPQGNKDLYAPHERSDWSLGGIAHRTLLRPFQILAQEPILVLITIYVSIVYGILYGLFEAVPVIFEMKRGFNLGESGLIFIAVGLGTTIGGMINVLVQLRYRQLTPFWRGMPPPEERLIGSMIAGPFLVLGAFWLGWTGEYVAVPWYVPALSLVPIGMSFTLVFISLLSYIVDCYTVYAASALAANTILRSAVGAAFPLFTRQAFNGLGTNWAASLLGFVALVLTPFPYIFYVYGSKIRRLSKFAPAFDLKIRQELEKEGKLPENSLDNTSPLDRNGLAASKKAAASKGDAEKGQNSD